MTEIHHHLSDITLAAYAAGNLDEHMSLIIATHLAMCPACRKQHQEFETIGGIELSSASEIAMSDNALSNSLKQLDVIDQLEDKQVANDLGGKNSSLPMPLRQFIPDGLENIAWRNMAPGIKYFSLDSVKSGKGTVRLLRIAPGITIPEHGHNGNELTLILKGSFSDEIGRFKYGDVADLDEDARHQPIADNGEDCICLIATEGPLKFKNLVPRVAQYFLGM